MNLITNRSGIKVYIHCAVWSSGGPVSLSLSNSQKTPEARLSFGRSIASPQPSCQTDISHPLAVDDVRLNAIPDFLLYGLYLDLIEVPRNA